MPKVNLRKIKSAPKLLFAAVLLIAVLLFLVAVAVAPSADACTPINSSNQTLLKAPSACYVLEVTDSAEEQQQGLSDRERLAEDTGMLFTFRSEAERCFWMKDMNFAIDMVWVGSDRRVIYVEDNVAPDTYPETYCHEGKYVIELNAGKAGEGGIKQGVKLDF